MASVATLVIKVYVKAFQGSLVGQPNAVIGRVFDERITL